jgi:hypothetical protein
MQGNYCNGSYGNSGGSLPAVKYSGPGSAPSQIKSSQMEFLLRKVHWGTFNLKDLSFTFLFSFH